MLLSSNSCFAQKRIAVEKKQNQILVKVACSCEVVSANAMLHTLLARSVSFFMLVTLLQERIEKNFSILGEENEEASRQKCRDLLRQLEEGLAQNLRDGVYAVEGGHQCYETDLKIIIQKYQERNDLGNQVRKTSDKCMVPMLRWKTTPTFLQACEQQGNDQDIPS